MINRNDINPIDAAVIGSVITTMGTVLHFLGGGSTEGDANKESELFTEVVVTELKCSRQSTNVIAKEIERNADLIGEIINLYLKRRLS